MGNRQYTVLGYPAPPPASGYPVPHPPPEAKSPNTANPNPIPKPKSSNNPNPNSNFCHSYICTGILLLLIFLIYAFVGVFFVVDLVWPKLDPHFGLNSLSLSGFKVSSHTVSGNWSASFTVVNPNKKAIISYTNLHATIAYQDAEVAIANRILPFRQETNSATNVSAAFFATLPYLDEPLLNRIVNDMNHGTIKFNVEFHATAHFNVGGPSFTSLQRAHNEHWHNVPVEISYNSVVGEFSDAPRNSVSY